MFRYILLAAVLVAAVTPAKAQEVSLHAAGSVTAALFDVARDFSDTYGSPITPGFGPSGLMRERIEAGRGGPVPLFARNRLCGLAGAHVQVLTDTLLDVMLDEETRLNTSTPQTDPSGDYAFALFDKSGPAETLKAKALHLTGGPRNAYAWVLDSDRADLFRTCCTNAVLARREVPALQIVQIPEALSVGADYGLIVLGGAPPEAWKLALRILSPAGQSVLAGYGFDAAAVPEED